MIKATRTDQTIEQTSPCLYPHQLVTGQDLEQFRQRLLVEIGQTLKEHLNMVPKKWLKTHEVRKLLKISPGTLQNLKAKGIIPYTRIGGVHYFDYDKIVQILAKGA
ncbi:MAG: helix-turn-helix domain-containing protein [Bacteroidota bacterium]|nr:helix-turn-helix domain-containing protein [Bacteroidota bacterium]MDP4254969.1 helix-turn-helix domain-containing protein [Bacteroidota bacterium]MDP4258081.1 helix-turn-helix domain-containing protein [Bacteroidota bacterium]